MTSRRIVSGLSACVAVGLTLAGCGGGGSDGGNTGTQGATFSGGTEDGESNASNSNSGDGDGDPAGDGDPSGDGDPTGPGDGDGDPAGDGDADSDTDGFKFDVATIPDTELDCQCGTTLDFSYVWIANSTQSTVTKLNTETMEEEGRFLTRADSNGSPSRTSVSLSGRAVAIANRNGGLVKVLSQHEDCDEMKNGMPGLQTSTDINFLPWGQDDCVDWFVPFDYTTQRPVAWAPGILDQGTCLYSDEDVWTAGCKPGTHQWVQVSLVDGDTGMIEFTVEVPGFECSSLSPYGGAVNANGDFWFTNLVPGNDRLGFVDRDTQEVQVINPPITPYGMTVDHDGNPWLANWGGNPQATAARYNVDQQTWDIADNHILYVYSGIQEDADGRMWMNYWNYDGQNLGTGGLAYIDMQTMEVSEPFDIGCQTGTCRGMSVDLNGMVWSTSMASNTAFRFNPETLEVATYDQLVGPYTYSDMTGWGIQSATCGPQG